MRRIGYALRRQTKIPAGSHSRRVKVETGGIRKTVCRTTLTSYTAKTFLLKKQEASGSASVASSKKKPLPPKTDGRGFLFLTVRFLVRTRIGSRTVFHVGSGTKTVDHTEHPFCLDRHSAKCSCH